MILQELFEASTFRKRSTSQMTYGFEFEVMTDNSIEDYEDVVQRIRNEYPFEDYVNKNIKYYDFRNNRPIYGFASTEDIAYFASQENPYEAKLVNEILNLSDNNYQLYYLRILSLFKKNLGIDIKIDNVSDFDDYVNKKYSSSVLENNLKIISNMDHKHFNKIIKNLVSNDFLYFSELISKNKIFDYIYDEDNNVIDVKDLEFSQLEDLFEDSEDIMNELEEDYSNYISELVNDENENNIINVKKLLEKNNITNVDVNLDESLGNDGVEIVTDKIYGIDEAIKQFKKIINFIRNDNGLSTNGNTGLHINIGTWEDISQLDLTKLLIFSNETQILKKMERQNNGYTKSLVKYIIEHLQHEENLQNYNKIIKDINEEILRNANHTSFIDFEKLINNGYIEIRGFGNEDYEYKSDYIIKMIQYLSRVMEIASNPEEAKQQYIKKLYKIFDLETDLSGKKQKENSETVLTPTEIKYITRFFPYSKKIIIMSVLQSNNSPSIIKSFLVPLMQYDEKLTNDDLRILNKLLNNISLPPLKYYENNIKGKSEKIDNLFQKFY